VNAIARAMQEQQAAINRIQEGVTEMKGAADQISHGIREQVRANRDFDQGLAEREMQIETIHEAVRFQMDTVQKVFSHFESSSRRLTGNVEKTAEVSRVIQALEDLSNQLRETAEAFRPAQFR
jgi:uncharacterized protein YukE